VVGGCEGLGGGVVGGGGVGVGGSGGGMVKAKAAPRGREGELTWITLLSTRRCGPRDSES